MKIKIWRKLRILKMNSDNTTVNVTFLLVSNHIHNPSYWYMLTLNIYTREYTMLCSSMHSPECIDHSPWVMYPVVRSNVEIYTVNLQCTGQQTAPYKMQSPWTECKYGPREMVSRTPRAMGDRWSEEHTNWMWRSMWDSLVIERSVLLMAQWISHRTDSKQKPLLHTPSTSRSNWHPVFQRPAASQEHKSLGLASDTRSHHSW